MSKNNVQNIIEAVKEAATIKTLSPTELHLKAAAAHDAAAMAKKVKTTDAAWTATKKAVEANPKADWKTRLTSMADDAVDHARHQRWEDAAEIHGEASEQHRKLAKRVN